MPHTRLSIVFLNFNNLKETQKTTEILLDLLKKNNHIEIIAVDNNSSDGTAEYLSNQTQITSVLLTTNDGIAGYTAGFEKASGEFLLVLDDDSSPVNFEGLEHAINKFDQHPEIGIIAAHINNSKGIAQTSWHIPNTNKFIKSPFFIGCGFIIRREVFKQIDWYPHHFFLYQNEIDVSFKVRMLGYQIYYDPECIIVHRGEPNQRPGWRRVYFPTRNTLFLIRKYYPHPIAGYMIFSRLIIGLVRAITFGELKHYFKGAKEGLTYPVNKTILSPQIRQELSVFQRQNSLFHLLVCLTKH